MDEKTMKEIIIRNREAMGRKTPDWLLESFVETNKKATLEAIQDFYNYRPFDGTILADGLIVAHE